ncbi:MAG: hypothetical protein ACJAT7_000687 [Psychromonas sp.]|jgi:hypothetical protein
MLPALTVISAGKLKLNTASVDVNVSLEEVEVEVDVSPEGDIEDPLLHAVKNGKQNKNR